MLPRYLTITFIYGCVNRGFFGENEGRCDSGSSGGSCQVAGYYLMESLHLLCRGGEGRGSYSTVTGRPRREFSAHGHPSGWLRAGNFHPGDLDFRPGDRSVSSTQHSSQPRAGINQYLLNVK